jgi:hypothetical protein
LLEQNETVILRSVLVNVASVGNKIKVNCRFFGAAVLTGKTMLLVNEPGGREELMSSPVSG